jgi:uncharacterized membrane protein
MKRLRNIMLAGLVALLPLYLTVTLLIWLFQTVDAFFQPLFGRLLGLEVYGLGVLATVLVVFVTGLVVSSVSGALLVDWMDRLLERVPLVKGLYRSIKRVVDSFNPSNPSGFKEFVLVRSLGGDGYNGGFLTGEFSLIGPDGRRDLAAVFIPSNHLYLGAIHIVDRARIVRVDMSLQDGVAFSLSAGASVKSDVRQLA